VKALAVLGSPRKEGNSAMLLRHVLQGMRASGEHDVVEVSLQQLSIAPCRNCDSCRRRTDLYCAIDDDMQGLYRPFIEAEAVILATPIYWWSISAQLKLFIDRLYGLNADANPQFFNRKKLVLILTHFDKIPCSGAQIALKMFEEIADYTKIEIAGVLQYSSGEKHVRESPEKLEEAQALGQRLGGRPV
jgi:NAD(P)H-dependent FMN reductase